MNSDIQKKEIRESFPSSKSDAIWAKYILRPLSFPVARGFIRLGFSANQITYISIILILFGSALLFFESFVLAIVAATFFNLFALLDCVDGNVARVTDGENTYGEWVDALGGYIAYTFTFVTTGWFVEATYQEVWLIDINFLLIGTIAALMNLLIRVQYQKFDNITGTNQKSKREEDSLQKRISRNIGITGFLMPSILIGVLLSLLHIILLFYASLYAAAWAFITLKKVIEVEKSKI